MRDLIPYGKTFLTRSKFVLYKFGTLSKSLLYESLYSIKLIIRSYRISFIASLKLKARSLFVEEDTQGE